jgi:cobalt-zinc-cadmium efflux system outer membrane protein
VKTGPLAMGAARRKLGRALAMSVAAAILAADPSARAAANAAPAPGATVEELLALVRNFNPDLAAAALDREQAVAKIYPAGALDDPMLNLGRDQGFRNTTFSVSQEFPLWGKRELRSGVATADAAAAKGREGSVAAELEEQVKVTFAQYYQSDRAIAVTGEIASLLRDLAGTVRARYGQGLGNQSDAIRADLEQTRLGPKLSALERDEQIATAKINALIAHPADAGLGRPASLRGLPAVASLKLDALMGRARNSNPMLATARAEIAAAAGERTLVDKSWYPDVTVSVGGNDLPGQSPGRLVAGVGIKIPLQWGVRDAQANAASAKKAAAQARLEGTVLRIESDLQAALATLRQAQRTEDLLKNALTQQSAAAYRSALVSYERGRGDLTPVLDAARQQLEIRLELLEAQRQEQAALAAIERLIGGDL